MAYGSIDCVKGHLDKLKPLPDPYPTDDEITTWLAFVTDEIDRYTGQYFEPRDFDLYIDGSGTPLIQFPINIIELTLIECYEILSDGELGTSTVLEPAQYKLNSGKTAYRDYRNNPSICIRRGRFPRECGNVHIVGRAGFVENDLTTPPIITKVACELTFKMLTDYNNSGQEFGDGNVYGQGPMTGEKTDGHEWKFSEAHITSLDPSEYLQGLFLGDAKLKSLLSLYRAPMFIGCP